MKTIHLEDSVAATLNKLMAHGSKLTALPAKKPLPKGF
jgi:hypothetical protein